MAKIKLIKKKTDQNWTETEPNQFRVGLLSVYPLTKAKQTKPNWLEVITKYKNYIFTSLS